MNETVDLTRARIVEFDVPSTNRAFLMKREHPSDSIFLGMYVDASRECDVDGVSLDYIKCHGTNIRVLAEFELTLAELLPEGCEAFQFCTPLGHQHAAIKQGGRNGPWEVTGMHGDWTSLDALAYDAAVDVNTVIPLTTHAEHVGSRR